jgi:hypothetical protein
MPIEPLGVLPLPDNQYQVRRPAAATAADKVQEEFLAIFYKELLKNAFQAPNLSPGDETEKDGANSTVSTFTSEMMVEQLAREMIKSGQLRPDFMRSVEKQ